MSSRIGSLVVAIPGGLLRAELQLVWWHFLFNVILLTLRNG